MSEAHVFTLYDRLVALPEHLVGEILDGELVASPRPRPVHSHASLVLSWALGGPYGQGVGGPGGWWLFIEPEIHLEPQVVVPDLAGWRRERLPAIPDDPYFTLAPDWVCEIISPATARIDRGVKRRIYAEAGIGWFWIVDPAKRTLEVLENRTGTWVTAASTAGPDTIAAPPFPAAPIPLAALWGEG